MSFSDLDFLCMKKARELALEAATLHNEVPIGAIVECGGEIIAQAANMKEQLQCAVDHAEILATRQASRHLGHWRLIDCTLYTTLEPCLMCSGAIIQARYKRVVFACPDPKAGGMGGFTDLFLLQGLNHYPVVESGLLGAECSADLSDFFRRRRMEIKNSRQKQLTRL